MGGKYNKPNNLPDGSTKAKEWRREGFMWSTEVEEPRRNTKAKKPRREEHRQG
jgi:hypothetical protein